MASSDLSPGKSVSVAILVHVQIRRCARIDRAAGQAKGDGTMDLGMTGKKAIVTGASAGIAKAVPRSLAREGVDVAICARRKEPLEEAAAEIAKDTGRKIVPFAADLTKPADAEDFINAARGAP